MNSKELFARAQKYLPGGVNSPVRAFGGVGGSPLFIDRARGALIYDVEGREYVDYVGSWGPMILGHAHPDVIAAVTERAAKGLSFGAPTALENDVAEKICQFVPSVEMLRMCNSGTEATMSAIRLARGFTGRDTIIKFEGCYHGHSDSLLVKAGSGALTFGEPTSPGVPKSFTEHTLVLPYNDAQAAQEAFARYGADIAAVIVEPVAGNMNCVLPKEGFLQSLRDLCSKHGSVFIMDEVMTGFRVARGGAQEKFSIRPDLCTFGKIIGGGMPVGAFAGRAEIMRCLSPLGPVYQAGTLSGNPVAMAAGLATLQLIEREGFYDELNLKTQKLAEGLRQCAAEAGIPLVVNAICGMFGIFFTEAKKVECFADVMRCDSQRFAQFFHAMLKRGVYLAPSAFEAGFVSNAHNDATLEYTLDAARAAFAALRDQTQA